MQRKLLCRDARPQCIVLALEVRGQVLEAGVEQGEVYGGRRLFALVRSPGMPMPKMEQPVPQLPPSSTAQRWLNTPGRHHSPGMAQLERVGRNRCC